MNRWIDYVDMGGPWAWLALAAGLVGVIAVVLAVGKRYKQPSAIFAMEMGLVAFAMGGIGWYIKDNAEMRVETAEQILRPVYVALGAGGAAIGLALVLFLVAGPTATSRRS